MDGPDGEGEEEQNRKLDELLGELRIVLPAVTVLFAFLLTLPFTARFGSLSVAQRVAYFTAFITSASSLVLLAAETAYHHIAGRSYDKRRMIATVSHQILAALTLLGCALGSVVFLVTDVLYGTWTVVATTAAIALLMLVSWFGIPFSRHSDG